MKFVRIAALTLVLCPFCFGASKEIIELQRDVGLLQDRMDQMQRDLDTKFGEVMQAVQDNNTKTAATLGNLQDSLNNGVTKSLTPVAGVSAKVDAMGDDIRALKDALNDLSARLERMDAKITDLKNTIQVMQNPPPAPGATPGQPGQTGAPSTPPPGMSADKTYTDALRDFQSGNTDLAQNEFTQYLQYFGNTELAASAQYYLGEIAYNKRDYQGAVQGFDAVLERYPQNPKTADAHLMKGMALVKSGDKTGAIQEFRSLIQNFPHTDDARKAQAQLRALGAGGSTTARRRPSGT
jgi:tol-pal system protein YbgF